MYARSTTVTGRPEAINRCVAYIRDEVQPAVTAMKGCQGLSMVVDRLSGRCIATSAWESEEAMLIADEAMVDYRIRAGEILGGEPDVDLWEVDLMHRAQPAGAGACCRVVWARPQDIHVLLDRFRSTLLPEIEAFDGFCSVSLFVDRLERRICSTTTFDSPAALNVSRKSAAVLREHAARDSGVEFLQVGEFDLALAHLRVPELV
jgi:hypothetical protein